MKTQTLQSRIAGLIVLVAMLLFIPLSTSELQAQNETGTTSPYFEIGKNSGSNGTRLTFLNDNSSYRDWSLINYNGGLSFATGWSGSGNTPMWTALSIRSDRTLKVNYDATFEEKIFADGDFEFKQNTSVPVKKIVWPNQVGQRLNFGWSGSGFDGYGIGIQSSTQYFRTGAHFAWYKSGSHHPSALNNGGGTTLMQLRGDTSGTVLSLPSGTLDAANAKISGEITATNLTADSGNSLSLDAESSSHTFPNIDVAPESTTFYKTVNFNKLTYAEGGIAFTDSGFPGEEAGRFGTINGNAFFRVPVISEAPQPGFSVYSTVSTLPILNVKQGTKDVTQYVGTYDRTNLIQANGVLDVNSYLHVGKKGSLAGPGYQLPDVIDDAVAHFDGRVYISEQDGLYSTDNDTEKGLDPSNSTYSEHLLWVEKGITTTHTAYLDVDQWHDYVFKADYKLNSIDELQSFIKTNGHLPTMPSEKEVLKNGFEAVDMTGRIVKTVEELTLHTINQEKLIKDQITEISTLKKTVQAQKELNDSLLKRLEALEKRMNDSAKK
jgi:hypothetical protein